MEWPALAKIPEFHESPPRLPTAEPKTNVSTPAGVRFAPVHEHVDDPRVKAGDAAEAREGSRAKGPKVAPDGSISLADFDAMTPEACVKFCQDQGHQHGGAVIEHGRVFLWG